MQESIFAATRDGMYGWTAERLARDQTAAGAEAFLYLFDHGYEAAEAADLGGFHACEIPYVLGTMAATPPNWPAIPATAAEARFSAAMIAYWASFVRNGRPLADDAPNWPDFAGQHEYLHFAEAPRVGNDEDWMATIGTNLNSVWRCINAETPAILATGGGSIVNLASIYGLVGSDLGRAAYSARKFGVVGLTKTAANDYALQNCG